MPALNTSVPNVIGDRGQLRTLRRLAQDGSAKLVGKSGEPVAIPATVRTSLAEIARNMEAGKAVSLVAENHELTTQRAANILGVSRPFLVRLLEESKVPFHMVGSHRRVYLADLLTYKSKRDRARHEAVKRLALNDIAAGTYDTIVLPEGAQDEWRGNPVKTLPAVILDANVLVQAPICDSVLRLDEGPTLYRPRWSAEIMAEVKRTLEGKFGITPARTAHLEAKLREYFPEAWIEGFEFLVRNWWRSGAHESWLERSNIGSKPFPDRRCVLSGERQSVRRSVILLT